jgi:hypothetical protein
MNPIFTTFNFLKFLSNVSPQSRAFYTLYTDRFVKEHISFIRATCPDNLIVLDLVTLIIFDEGCILWRIWSYHNGVMKGLIFWDITPCSPFKVNRSFGEICRFHLQGRRISSKRPAWTRYQAGGMFVRNAGSLSMEYTALYCGRKNSSQIMKLSVVQFSSICSEGWTLILEMDLCLISACFYILI